MHLSSFLRFINVDLRHSQSFQILPNTQGFSFKLQPICIWVAFWHFGFIFILVLIYGMILVCVNQLLIYLSFRAEMKLCSRVSTHDLLRPYLVSVAREPHSWSKSVFHNNSVAGVVSFCDYLSNATVARVYWPSRSSVGSEGLYLPTDVPRGMGFRAVEYISVCIELCRLCTE